MLIHKFENLKNSLIFFSRAVCFSFFSGHPLVRMKIMLYYIFISIFPLANRIHPGKNKVFFSDDDPRKRYSVKNFDPRIHFALNCGAKVSYRSAFFYFFFTF